MLTLFTTCLPCQVNSPSDQRMRCTDKWLRCKAGSFSYGKSPRTPPLEGNSLHRRNKSVERPWGILSLFITCLQVKSPAKGCDTFKWCRCKAGSFSFGELPRTPPLEGTSLHRRSKSVERPWGILSLLATCLPVKPPCQRL